MGVAACTSPAAQYEEAYRDALQVGFNVGFRDLALRAAVLGKLGRQDEVLVAGWELLEEKPGFESRVRELLAYTFKQSDVVDDFLDGLRQAGLRID